MNNLRTLLAQRLFRALHEKVPSSILFIEFLFLNSYLSHSFCILFFMNSARQSLNNKYQSTEITPGHYLDKDLFRMVSFPKFVLLGIELGVSSSSVLTY